MHNTPNIVPMQDQGDVDKPEQSAATAKLSAPSGELPSPDWEDELERISTQLLDLAARCACGDVCTKCKQVFLIGSIVETHADFVREAAVR